MSTTLAATVSTAVCLWLDNPYRLISLLEIMKHARVSELVKHLRHFSTCANYSKADDPKHANTQLVYMDADLEELGMLCAELDLQVSVLHIREARQHVVEIKDTSPSSLAGVASILSAAVCGNIEKELSLKRFFLLPSERVRSYDEPTFGTDADNSFPSSSFDTSEACKCFALRRSTACVFHLMRVLEIGLGVFAGRFGVPSDHTNWHNIIEGIEKAVRGMGSDPSRPADWKDQQEFFSQAASAFMFIKDAWRNYTAHARGKYTEEEAETILINVRGFMQKLATRLHE